ncbi:hypothetical protein [Deinococcus budaensis]|uniref:Uncharacterized protein n=1 Tax=Deinococcus budaensis TaxID=1665626 RepID=A0A7W8GDD2_9DEIO|nr:hypothetical protein [Deinococcus budaensis]MBB5233221.1 hypothetical protein [Deinococcus budaensis]
MNLPEIAWGGGWRDLVTPGLVRSLHRLEAQGVVFAWAAAEADLEGAGHGAPRYVFSARREGALLASHDGSETPRQAISEVILGAMSACGAFAGQQPGAAPQGRSRLTETETR